MAIKKILPSPFTSYAEAYEELSTTLTENANFPGNVDDTLEEIESIKDRAKRGGLKNFVVSVTESDLQEESAATSSQPVSSSTTSY